jgi:RNA polymerase sigma factor (sigma-70 family)
MVALLPRPPGPYEEHRDYVLRVLSRRCRWLDPADREAIMHEAYALFLEKQRDGKLDIGAMRPPQVRAYLTQTALNKAMDEGKRAGRRSLSLSDEQLGLDPPDPGRDLGEGLASRFDDARVREIVAELPERQQLVIKLRFFFGRSPQEIQRHLGVTERVYRRELERATRHIAERFELVRHGGFCESRRSLILAYVTGIAGPTRAAEARRHLDTCPACAYWAAELRATTTHVARVLTPPSLTMPVAHGLLGRSAALVHGARQRAAELAAATRSHAAKVFVHVDPSNASVVWAARPGAAAVLVAGCLAAGTTTTYCVVHGIPAPIRSLFSDSGPARYRARPVSGPAAGPVSRTGPSGVTEPLAPGGPVPRSVAMGVLASSHMPGRPRSERKGSSSSTGATGSARARARRSESAAKAEFGFERTGTASSSPAPSKPSSSASASEFGFEHAGPAASSSTSRTASPSGSGSGHTPSRSKSAALSEFGP